MDTADDIKRDVEKFWNQRPCDSDRSVLPKSTAAYYAEIERDRYELQHHIPASVFPKIDWRGKRVLEIGTGVGTDARALIARGAIYHGINIDQGSVDMTRNGLELFGLPGTVQKCDATAMPFPDASFDVVYSYGALPCIPDLDKAIAEIHRVLKPGGDVLGLFYNKSSINYHVEIRLLRRAFRPLLMVPGVIPLLAAFGLPRDTLLGHRELYRKHPRMSAQEWLSRNTDGPDNPFICVQDAGDATRLFQRFDMLANDVYFFDHRHWGALGRAMPRGVREWLGRRWGWHRVVHARKPPVGAASG